MPRTADPEKQLVAKEINQTTMDELNSVLTEVPKQARKVLREGFKVEDAEGNERDATPAEIVQEVRKIIGRCYTKTQRDLKQHEMFEESNA